MRYPFINARGRNVVSVPDLLGGLNYRDGLSGVNDNQMTDGLNVYEKDGRLVTRCGYDKKAFSIPKNITDLDREFVYSEHEIIGYYKKSVIIAIYRNYGTVEEGTSYSFRKYYYLISENGVKSLGNITTMSSIQFVKDVKETIKDNYLYLIISEGETVGTMYDSCSAQRADLEAETPQLANTDIYIPTAYINYLPLGAGFDFEAVQFEGQSILTNKIKIIGSTVNPSETTHNARYRLPLSVKLGTTVTIKTISRTTSGTGTQENTHTVEVTSANYDSTHNGYFESTTSAYKIKVSKERNLISFFNTDTSWDTPMTYTNDDYIEGNLEIIYEPEYTEVNSELRQAVFSCTSQVWYGGAANGISSGSRLFLGGCSDAKYRNYIFWSGLNDPTALLENCCAGVGDKSTGVTAFGQQGENLVIFKEASTHYTKTQYNNEITAEGLINQNIVDYSANAVYFPLIDINSEIGCDLPNTVQLCRNRLVWANKDGKVYALANFNQFSQTNVYQVSEMIENETTRKSIVGGRAVAYENYYVLQYKIQKEIQSGANTVTVSVYDEICYLMYADSVGYNKITKYDTDTAQKQIAWYKWSIEGQLINSIEYIKVGTTNIEIYALGDNDYDANGEIQSMVKTKAFDFSAPYLRKFVESVNITLGNNDAKPIKVTFITDGGEYEDEIIPYSDETNGKDIGYFETYHLMPRLKGFCRVALQLESTGKIDVDRLNIIYRFLGGVK